jgi:hypothetical protein
MPHTVRTFNPKALIPLVNRMISISNNHMVSPVPL